MFLINAEPKNNYRPISVTLDGKFRSFSMFEIEKTRGNFSIELDNRLLEFNDSPILINLMEVTSFIRKLLSEDAPSALTNNLEPILYGKNENNIIIFTEFNPDITSDLNTILGLSSIHEMDASLLKCIDLLKRISYSIDPDLKEYIVTEMKIKT